MCVSVWACVCELCTSLCVICLVWGGNRSQTKKIGWKNWKESVQTRNLRNEEEKRTKLTSPWFLPCPALGLVFFPLVLPWSTIRPHLHLQWPADVREWLWDSRTQTCLHDHGSVEKQCYSSADCHISRWHPFVCVRVNVWRCECMKVWMCVKVQLPGKKE